MNMQQAAHWMWPYLIFILRASRRLKVPASSRVTILRVIVLAFSHRVGDALERRQLRLDPGRKVKTFHLGLFVSSQSLTFRWSNPPQILLQSTRRFTITSCPTWTRLFVCIISLIKPCSKQKDKSDIEVHRVWIEGANFHELVVATLLNTHCCFFNNSSWTTYSSSQFGKDFRIRLYSTPNSSDFLNLIYQNSE